MRGDEKVAMAGSNKPAAGPWRTDPPPKDGERILAVFEGIPMVVGWDYDFACWLQPFGTLEVDKNGEQIDGVMSGKVERWVEIIMPKEGK